MELQVLNSNNYQNQPVATQKNNPPKRSPKAIAVGAAIAGIPSAYMAFDTVWVKPDFVMEEMAKFMQKGMPDIDTFQNVKAAAQKAIRDTGLGANGLTLKTVNVDNIDAVTREIAEAAKGTPFANRISQNFAKMFKFGVNAVFVPELNNVYIGEKGLYSSVFHELGHALNYNSSKFMKFMQKARILTPYGIPAVGLGLFAAGLLHRVKPESQEQPKSLWEKTKDFIKKHSGKLTLLTFMPMLVEEVAASVKGIKIAKNYFTPEQVSKLVKGYKYAFGSYAQLALGLSAIIGLANMVADGIQKKSDEAQKQTEKISS